MTDERRGRLRALLDMLAAGAGGPPERAETAALLDDAVGDGVLHVGQRADDVRALLGPPHFTRGDPGGAEGWGYPTLPRPGEEPKGARWFVWMEMRGGIVESLSRRAWIAGR
jgi:hypothetical protein